MDSINLMSDESDTGEVEEGGYDCETLAEPSSELLCIICMKLMKDPVQFSCGHGMCNICYKQLKKHSETKTKVRCPQCRVMVNQRTVTKNFMLNRLILSIRVKCPNTKLGCDWVCDLGDIKEHLCGYEKTKCINTHCNAIVERRKLYQHLPECNMKVINQNTIEVCGLQNKINDQNLEINILRIQLRDSKNQHSSLENEVKLLRQRISTIERSLLYNKKSKRERSLSPNEELQNLMHESETPPSVSLPYRYMTSNTPLPLPSAFHFNNMAARLNPCIVENSLSPSPVSMLPFPSLFNMYENKDI